MIQDILITQKGDFTQYSSIPLVADDVMAYRLVFRADAPLTGVTFQITAIRADGIRITDIGTVQEGCGYYIIKNNMHSIVGQTIFRLTLLSETGSVLTTKELICTVIEGNGEPDITGEDRVPVLSGLISQATQAAGFANEQGNYARDKADAFMDNASLYRGLLPDSTEPTYTFSQLGFLPEGVYRVDDSHIGSLALPTDRGYGTLPHAVESGGYLHIRYIPDSGMLRLMYEDDRGMIAVAKLAHDDEGITTNKWADIRSFPVDYAKDFAQGGTIYEHVNDEGLHVSQAEKAIIGSAILQKQLPAPDGDKYTYGELKALPDGFYYVYSVFVGFLNLPNNCDFGFLKKTQVNQQVAIQYTDGKGYVYYAILTDPNPEDIISSLIWKANTWGEWYALTPINGWTGTILVRKNALGDVEWRGSVAGGTGSSTIVNVPAEFRPANTYFYLVAANSFTYFATGYISSANGTFRVDNTPSTIRLNDIHYNTVE